MSGETVEPTSMPPVDQEALAAQARMLSELATHPEFMALLREIQYAPESERLATAERLANLQSLRDRGIDLPEGLRLTTRFFEDPNNLFTGSVRIDQTEMQSSDEPILKPGEVSLHTITVCVSAGYGICASIGGVV